MGTAVLSIKNRQPPVRFYRFGIIFSFFRRASRAWLWAWLKTVRAASSARAARIRPDQVGPSLFRQLIANQLGKRLFLRPRVVRGPITINGEQYAAAGADYSYGINVNASADEQAAAMVFVKWMTEESGFSYNEDGLPVDADSTETKLSFEGVTFLEDEPAVAGEEDLLNQMNTESELNINAGGDAKIQSIIEHAFNGTMTFDEIMDDWNQRWTEAQEALEVEVTQ